MSSPCRARVRLAVEGDAAGIQAVYEPYVAQTVVSFEEEVPSVGTMAARLRDGSATYPWLVAERDGAILGYAYGSVHRTRAAYRWSVEVSVYLAQAERGRGLGRRLYEPLLAILTVQGFHRAFAGITLPNPASVGFHEALGFVPIGVFPEIGRKHGAWHDVGWWQRALSQATGAEPPAITPLPALLRDDPGLDRLLGSLD